MLPALRITCVCYRVYSYWANSSFPSLRVSRTGPPRTAMGARRTLHHASLSRFVHVLFTLFCGRGALVLRRADTCAMLACGGGGGGGGDASAAFLGCIIYRSFVESAHFLLIPRVCSSSCGVLTSSAQLVAGRPARQDFPHRLRLQQLPPCER